jgi:hypothetical protein
MSTAAAIVIAAILGIVVGTVAFYLVQRSRTQSLRQHFGSEYSRTMAETGDRWRAESALRSRTKRVERLHIRPLDRSERLRFLDALRGVQARFVDDPDGTLVEADNLIGSVMAAEGYPVGDFEQRAADISVDHPRVVENYRSGHEIAVRQKQGRVDTEDLRQAIIHYRTLFEDLLGQPEYTQTGEMA